MPAAAHPFVWYELMTTDPAAARAFYAEVFGWTMRDSGLAEPQYTMISAGDREIGGLMELPPAALATGARPCWTGYIASDDVDADAARVMAAGGRTYCEPRDIPGVGRFAVMADPHGASFTLFRGNGEAMPPAAPAWTPGHVGWHELHAGDGPAAFDFYSGMFGWTKDQALDMGPMGTYQIFAIDGAAVGGMMTKTPDMPHPMWLYYVTVKSVDATLARATAAGAKLLMGPHEVPGGAWIVQCLDPQGAMFAMVGGRG